MNELHRDFQRIVELIEDEIWHWDPAGIVDSRAETPAEYHQIASLLATQISRADNLDVGGSPKNCTAIGGLGSR